jgi:hypothetical protein
MEFTVVFLQGRYVYMGFIYQGSQWRLEINDKDIDGSYRYVGYYWHLAI